MTKEDIIISDLKEIYEESTFEKICDSENTTKGGYKVKSFTVTYGPWYYSGKVAGENIYQVALTADPKRGREGTVNVVVNIIQYAYGAGRYFESLYLDSKHSKYRELFIQVPAKSWDLLRNGVLSGVMDYIDNMIETKYAA